MPLHPGPQAMTIIGSEKFTVYIIRSAMNDYISYSMDLLRPRGNKKRLPAKCKNSFGFREWFS